MNTKRGNLQMWVIVFLVITVVTLVPWLFLTAKTLFLLDSIPKNVVECQQSALASLQTGSYLPTAQNALKDNEFKFVDIPFICPATELKVTSKTLSRSVTGSQNKDIYKKHYSSKEEFNLDLLMWNEMKICYQKMFYGQSPIFARDFLEDSDKCVVCSIIDFDDEVISEFGGERDLTFLLTNKTIGVSKVTLHNLSQDHPEVSRASLQANYELREKIGILYMRSNEPLRKKLSVSFGLSSHNFLGGWSQHVEIGGKDEYTEDFESVIIIDYKSGTRNDNYNLNLACDEIVAQLEGAQV